jgi:anti-anti-sigma factor
MRRAGENVFGKVETLNVEGAPHIRLTGECDISVAPTVQEHLVALMETGSSRLIFDLEHTTFLDSSILRIFLGARRAAPRRTEVILLCRPGFIRRLLSLLELDQLLQVWTPEEWRERTAAVH